MWFASSCSEKQPSAFQASAPTRPGPEIRVLLGHAPAWIVEFSGEVDVISADERQLLFRGALSNPFFARMESGALRIDGRLLKGGVRLSHRVSGSAESAGLQARAEADSGARWSVEPPADSSGRLSFLIARPGEAPRRHRGTLELQPEGDEMRAVVSLSLEDYLAGVVASEMPAAFPLEALKAQAIASRSYALYSLRQAKERGRELIVSSSATFQVYRGVASEYPRALEALAATRGEVLTYLGKMFRSYFHSTCGGQTARAVDMFGDVDIPPLGGARCGGCDGTRFFEWNVVLSRREIEEALRGRVKARGEDVIVGAIRHLEVSEIGPDGRARFVRIEHDGGSLEWRADRFRRTIEARRKTRSILSTYFEIAALPDGESYRVSGHGWGHGVGLCQMGCRGLAREKNSYRQILGRYYPHATIQLAY